MDLSYEVLRKDAHGRLNCIEAVSDAEAAKALILHLAERFPAEYVIMHRPTSAIVANFHFKQKQFTSITSESLGVAADFSQVPGA